MIGRLVVTSVLWKEGTSKKQAEKDNDGDEDSCNRA